MSVGSGRRAWLGLVAATAIGLTVTPSGIAWAAFRGTAAGAVATASAQLAPPTGVTAVCDFSLVITKRVKASWATSTSTFADGYVITFTPASGTASSATVGAGATTATSTAVLILTPSTTYTVRVTATAHNWTAAASAVTVTC